MIEPISDNIAVYHDRGKEAGRLGDARWLEWPDNNVDTVLLVGPLYRERKETP